MPATTEAPVAEEEITLTTLHTSPQPSNAGNAPAGKTLDQQVIEELPKLEFEIGDTGGSTKVTITPMGGVPIFTTPQPGAAPNGAQNPAPGQSLQNQTIRNRLNALPAGGTITLRLCTTVTVQKK
jgi:hypothetical protein